MDLLGEIIWYAAFIIPIPLFLIIFKSTKDCSIALRVITSIVAAVVVALFLAFIAIIIICRNGLGPS